MKRTVRITDGIVMPEEFKEATLSGAQVRIDMGVEKIAFEALGTKGAIMIAAGILLRDLALQLRDKKDTETDIIGMIVYIARLILELNDMEAAAADTGDAI